MTQRAAGAMVIVVLPSSLDLAPRGVDRQELVSAHAFVARPTVERLDEAFFDRLSVADEVELHAAPILPTGPLPARSARSRLVLKCRTILHMLQSSSVWSPVSNEKKSSFRSWS